MSNEIFEFVMFMIYAGVAWFSYWLSGKFFEGNDRWVLIGVFVYTSIRSDLFEIANALDSINPTQ